MSVIYLVWKFPDNESMPLRRVGGTCVKVWPLVAQLCGTVQTLPGLWACDEFTGCNLTWTNHTESVCISLHIWGALWIKACSKQFVL